VSEEERNKTAWDSNAITPGTPFMDLLASSLRYWVVKKLNTDPGWKNVSDFCVACTTDTQLTRRTVASLHLRRQRTWRRRA
jgi:hypothetical protein